jgi:hypothetical protein
MAENELENLVALNYCVSFIDLLGQREAARGQSLLPSTASVDEANSFHETFRSNIGGILQLQKDVDELAKGLCPDPNSPLRESLDEGQKAIWDEIQNKSVKTQYWSDGFVRFACLGDTGIKCRMNGVNEIFITAGYFCLLGLARRRPVRGAIDIAWGVEIRPGELYGPAVIRAYELESEVAQYPRIVVGQAVIPFLEAHKMNSGNDPIVRASQVWAQRCLDMLAQDDDGNWIIHYLGDAFQTAVTNNHHGFLYGKARDFVVQQVLEHKKVWNSKLAFRYSQLLAYFDAHPPSA